MYWMEHGNWTEPLCVLCKNKIERPKDALYQLTLLKGDVFWHATCYASSLRNVNVGRDTAAKEIIREAEKGNRKVLQGRMVKTFFYGMFAALFVPLGIFLFFNNKDLAGIDLSTGILLFMPFLLFTAYTAIYLMKVKAFEKKYSL